MHDCSDSERTVPRFLPKYQKSSLPLLTKLAESRELCELGQRMLRDDILASNLYTSVVTDKFKTAFLNEYKQRIIKI